MNYSTIKEVCKAIRRDVIYTSHTRSVPHLGSCLSCVDILVYLYWVFLDLDVEEIANSTDTFILSKGHAAPLLFQILAHKGVIEKEVLRETYGMDGSFFHEHPPKPGLIPGIEAATGSLGHGYPIAVGMAQSSVLKGKNNYTVALLGDGECNEGSIWESAFIANSLSLKNLIAIVDLNGWQATEKTHRLNNGADLSHKWRSFGHCVYEVDGNDIIQLDEVFSTIKDNEIERSSPVVIIANTKKGAGVSFMEDDNNWHYRIPNYDELARAMEELR